MVDSIKGAGAPPVTTQRSSVDTARTAVKPDAKTEIKDQVEISARALNLQQAQEAAKQTRGQLQDSEISLGLGPSFVSENG